MLTSRTTSEPGELPPPAFWPLLGPENAEFKRVRLNVSFPKSTDALVYTSGSALRDDAKGVGYFVFSPAKLANGPSIVVNRGFTADRNYPQAEGAQEIVGVLRWPESPSLFVPERDSPGTTWFARDHQAMARALGWGDVAQFYIEQEAPVPPGGVPHPSALKVRLRNDHLQYAITWYSLAGVLVVMFAHLGAASTQRRGRRSGRWWRLKRASRHWLKPGSKSRIRQFAGSRGGCRELPGDFHFCNRFKYLSIPCETQGVRIS